MNTGDIVMYRASTAKSSWWLVDKFISTFTQSPWVHVGIVLKDPKWLGIKGTYLWESAWTGIPDSVDDKKKFGVQIVPLAERMIPGSTFYRKYSGPRFSADNLRRVYDEIHDKPYDINPVDWVQAFIGYDHCPQREQSFWCSAMVACVLTKLNSLPEDTDWTTTIPSFFAGNIDHYGPISKLKHF